MANARRGARCRARPSARTRISDVRPDWVECGTLRAIDRSGGACPADVRRSADAARRGRPGTLVTPMLAASPHVPRLPSRQVASPGHWSGRHRSSPEGRSLRAARAPRKRVFASRCQTVCLEADGGASQQRTYCLLARARTRSPPDRPHVVPQDATTRQTGDFRDLRNRRAMPSRTTTASPASPTPIRAPPLPAAACQLASACAASAGPWRNPRTRRPPRHSRGTGPAWWQGQGRTPGFLPPTDLRGDNPPEASEVLTSTDVRNA